MVACAMLGCCVVAALNRRLLARRGRSARRRGDKQADLALQRVDALVLAQAARQQPAARGTKECPQQPRCMAQQRTGDGPDQDAEHNQ